MSTLFIKQTHSNGFTRTWRINPGQGPQTLGSSRLADMTSLSPKAPGIEGVFEFGNQAWHWVNLATDLTDPKKIKQPIDAKTKIQLHDSHVEFYFAEKPNDVFTKLEASTAAANGGKQLKLEIVKFGDQVLSVKTVPESVMLSETAKRYKASGGDKVSVLHRAIKQEDTEDLTNIPMQARFDKDARKNFSYVLGCALLFLGVAIFGPKSDLNVPVAAVQSRVSNLTLKHVPPKNRQSKEVAAKQKAQDASQNNAGRKNVVQSIKNISSGRLTKLLGKVALHTANTKNAIVTRGIASVENTGSAMAAVGKIDRSGMDWGHAAKGSGVNISTSGNGKGVSSGFGQLHAGNTGKAGVGLIEDESEITGGLDREVIAQIIKSYLGQVLYCYERQLSANPDLFGKVAVRFTINASGNVETQKIGDTTLRNSVVENCILQKIAGWKFPAPVGGTKVVVSYPFLFKSTN